MLFYENGLVTGLVVGYFSVESIEPSLSSLSLGNTCQTLQFEKLSVDLQTLAV